MNKKKNTHEFREDKVVYQLTFRLYFNVPW